MTGPKLHIRESNSMALYAFVFLALFTIVCDVVDLIALAHP